MSCKGTGRALLREVSRSRSSRTRSMMKIVVSFENRYLEGLGNKNQRKQYITCNSKSYSYMYFMQAPCRAVTGWS